MASDDGKGGPAVPRYKSIPTNHANRRRAVRIRTIRNARIKFGNTSLDCVLLDFSSRGARVNVGSATDIPKRLVVMLHDNSTHDAALRWARDREIGVEFIKESDGQPGAAPQAASQAVTEDLGRLLFQGDASHLADASPEHRARVTQAAQALEEACRNLRKAIEACD